MNADQFTTATGVDQLTVMSTDGVHCVLAAGDASDIRELVTWCNNLPSDCYGTVFIEVFSPLSIQELALPPNLSVTWICREPANHEDLPERGQPRGQALARAVDAWMDEWWRVEDDEHRSLSMWTGAHTSAIMRRYWLNLRFEFADRRAKRQQPPFAA